MNPGEKASTAVQKVFDALGSDPSLTIYRDKRVSKDLVADIVTETGNEIFIHEIKIKPHDERKKEEVIDAIMCTLRLHDLEVTGNFLHSEDYRTVTMRGIRYELSPQQAHIIQILHEAVLRRMPDVSQQYVLEKIESRTSRIRDSFRTDDGKKAFKALIAKGKRKGTIRLNV